MPTIKVEEVTRREIEVEAQFPVYSKHDHLLDEIDLVEFRRWDADGTLWTITRRRGFGWHGTSDGFEISKAKLALSGVHHGDSRRLLGLGDHACTAAEFNEVLREAREFLAGIEGSK